MRKFPPELVGLVIDKLAEPDGSPSGQRVCIEDYSTVSREWVAWTQAHHFHYTSFLNQDDVERWRTIIKADPFGVSRHVCKMTWTKINTLQGFDKHLYALTRVRDIDLSDCGFLRSLPDVKTFTALGSSLEELEIDGALTTPHLMATLLANLPHLHTLTTYLLDIRLDRNSVTFPSVVPFFDGAGELSLSMMNYSPGKLDWIPPTARFRRLQIEASLICNNCELVNKWLASSCESLERFVIQGDSRGDSLDAPFDRLDLLRGESVVGLQLPVPLADPGKYAKAFLPLISSSRISSIILHLQAKKIAKTSPGDWGELDKELCRLAKRFKDAHNGRMMEVMVLGSDQCDLAVLEQLKKKWPMPNLAGKATIVIPIYGYRAPRVALPWSLELHVYFG